MVPPVTRSQHLTAPWCTDATSDTYTPKVMDLVGTLTATASYFDGQSAPDIAKKMAEKMADNAVAADTRNRAPVFADQDTETDGVQNTETTRKNSWRRTLRRCR